jgi:UDP-2,3-diacylglucosamine pyrophosphatase LpxH
MIYFVSDLHIGEAKALEDFALWTGPLPRRKTPQNVRPAVRAMHARWSAFIDHILEQSRHEPAPTELVLLGDILDLLQVTGNLCDPEKIRRVAKGHEPWFRDLARAAAAGVRIAWVVGNHDHELFDPAVWAALRALAPYLNADHGGEPLAAWREHELAIHAEHGSQLDRVNALADFLDPMALSLGSRVVLDLINAFEPRCPMLDLMPDVATALWYALTRAPGLLARPLRRFLFGTKSPEAPPPNLDFLPEVENLLRRVWLRELPRPDRKILRETLGLIAAALQNETQPAAPATPATSATPAGTDSTQSQTPPSPLPPIPLHPMARIRDCIERRQRRTPRELRRLLLDPVHENPARGRPLRLVVTGHTHRPLIEPRKHVVHLANCGSWKARVCPAGRVRFRIEQPLEFLAVRPRKQDGRLEVALRSFRCLRDEPGVVLD